MSDKKKPYEGNDLNKVPMQIKDLMESMNGLLKQLKCLKKNQIINYS